jgi:cytochrome c
MTRPALGAAIAFLATAMPVLAEELGDAERGAEIFSQCSGCHELGPEAGDRIGPNLNGVFGRKAGSVADFQYSRSLARAGSDGLVWDLDTLDVYLENPRTLVSGTRMSFRGLPEPQDRDDVLAYLRQFSASPQDIPEAVPTARPHNPDEAVSPEILAIQGDPAYGQYLSSECKTCHLSSGGDEGIPSITNWPAEDFVVAMHAYKRKIRPHPGMQMMAGRLSDEEIAALAAYFETIE